MTRLIPFAALNVVLLVAQIVAAERVTGGALLGAVGVAAMVGVVYRREFARRWLIAQLVLSLIVTLFAVFGATVLGGFVVASGGELPAMCCGGLLLNAALTIWMLNVVGSTAVRKYCTAPAAIVVAALARASTPPIAVPPSSNPPAEGGGAPPVSTETPAVGASPPSASAGASAETEGDESRR